MTWSMKDNPNDLVGKDVPAADGGNYGHRIVGYDPEYDDYLVRAICWRTGKYLDLDPQPRRIQRFKLSYRYVPDLAREAKQ